MDDKKEYRAWFVEEERKLRWLICRHPATLELHYYLVFMLLAHQRWAEAAHECEEILGKHPQDFMAQAWMSLLRRPSSHGTDRYPSTPRGKVSRHRCLGHIRRSENERIPHAPENVRSLVAWAL